MAKKKGLISRFIEGPERSESYAMSTLPTNRWQLGWDVFKGNISKMIGLNLLTLLFMLPLIFLLVLRYFNGIAYSITLPLGQNFAGGYPFYPSSVGLEAEVGYYVNRQFFLWLILAVLVAAIGVSGGFYVMKNLVWTESVMVGSDFFKGVKQNYFVVMFSLLIYSVLLALLVLSINLSMVLIARNEGIRWLLIIQQAISYILIFFFTIAVLFMITLGITYKLKFRALIKNSLLFTVGLLPLNVFFAAFAAVLFLLFFIGVSFLTMLAVLLCLFFGFSLFMLIWMNYSQWAFDRFINDKVPGAKKNRGIYKPTAEENVELTVEKSKYAGKHIKPITDYEMEVYELPTSFSRKDLQRLEESKEAIRRDRDKYEEEQAKLDSSADQVIEELYKNDSAKNEDK